jgi:hypothetical protein
VIESWSDGGRLSHDLTIPVQDVALVVRYRDAGPAPFSGSAAATPFGDESGPVIRLRRRAGRTLAGTVSDPAGVGEVKVAVRRGCRWWSARAGRLVRRGRCAKPRWMNATLKPVATGTWAWTLRLAGRLPRKRYTLVLRARDDVGNVTRRVIKK